MSVWLTTTLNITLVYFPFNLNMSFIILYIEFHFAIAHGIGPKVHAHHPIYKYKYHAIVNFCDLEIHPNNVCDMYIMQSYNFKAPNYTIFFNFMGTTFSFGHWVVTTVFNNVIFFIVSGNDSKFTQEPQSKATKAAKSPMVCGNFFKPTHACMVRVSKDIKFPNVSGNSIKLTQQRKSRVLKDVKLPKVSGIPFSCLQNPKSRIIKVFIWPNVCGIFVKFLQNLKHKDVKDVIVSKLHGNLIKDSQPYSLSEPIEDMFSSNNIGNSFKDVQYSKLSEVKELNCLNVVRKVSFK